MSRVPGPKEPVIPGHAFGGWFLLIALWGLAAVTLALWAAAGLAALLTGGTVAPLGTGFVADVLHGRTADAWPGTPTWAVAGIAAALAVAAAAVALPVCRAVLRRLPAAGDPVAALARNPRLAEFQALPTARRAIRRPASRSLARRHCDRRRRSGAPSPAGVGAVVARPGIGKTSLLKRFRATADVPVGWGSSPDHETAPAL
ncbi:hypothetical protein [Microbispora sp. CA-102843]|uniref:hypothetical protein n=1 Tax=Microbispora sp. CA-102843 TaxID=3239952 RepID=UPI003D92DD0E